MATTRSTISWDGQTTKTGPINQFLIPTDGGRDVEQQQEQQNPKSLANKPFSARANADGSYENLPKANGQAVHAGKVTTSDNIMSTFRREGHNELVDLPDGLGTTSLEAALVLGYLQRDPNGTIIEVPRSDQQPVVNQQTLEYQAAEQEKLAAIRSTPIDPVTVKTIQEFDSKFGSQFTDSVLAITADELASVGEKMDGSKLDRYASRAGMEPEQFLGEVNKIIGGFQHQASQYMSKKYGVDGMEALEWATENIQKDNLREIFNRHIHSGDLRPYDALAKEYLGHRK